MIYLSNLFNPSPIPFPLCRRAHPFRILKAESNSISHNKTHSSTRTWIHNNFGCRCLFSSSAFNKFVRVQNRYVLDRRLNWLRTPYEVPNIICHLEQVMAVSTCQIYSNILNIFLKCEVNVLRARAAGSVRVYNTLNGQNGSALCEIATGNTPNAPMVASGTVEPIWRTEEEWCARNGELYKNPHSTRPPRSPSVNDQYTLRRLEQTHFYIHTFTAAPGNPTSTSSPSPHSKIQLADVYADKKKTKKSNDIKILQIYYAHCDGGRAGLGWAGLAGRSHHVLTFSIRCR